MLNKLPFVLLFFPILLSGIDKLPSVLSLVFGASLLALAIVPWAVYYSAIRTSLKQVPSSLALKAFDRADIVLFVFIIGSLLLPIELGYYAYWLFEPILDANDTWIVQFLECFAPIATIFLSIQIARVYWSTGRALSRALIFWFAVNAPIILQKAGESLPLVGMQTYSCWFIGLSVGYALALLLLRDLSRSDKQA
ncbi:MAG TPA: hypothetical protein V6C97_04220 [Oculatellaceae cyanobacterium]